MKVEEVEIQQPTIKRTLYCCETCDFKTSCCHTMVVHERRHTCTHENSTYFLQSDNDGSDLYCTKECNNCSIDTTLAIDYYDQELSKIIYDYLKAKQCKE